MITLLIVLGLEFYFKIGSEYRNFSWFTKLRHYLASLFSERSFFESWGGIAVILLVPVIALYAMVSIFGGGIYWFVLFIVSVVVLFLSIGPNRLEDSFEAYFHSIAKADYEGASHHLNEINDSLRRVEKIEGNEPDEIVRAATRSILIESHTRYFGVISWFIFFGPCGALFYRLAHLYRSACSDEGFNEHSPLLETLIHWIDWIPARITGFLFMLTGDFVKGVYRIQDYLTDAEADNSQLISETGIAALGLDMGRSDSETEENQLALAMANRTIIFYLVLGAVLSTLF
ncbi:MAG: regulatory signaling modulator protein AmpE [Kangiellaceae bacterium]|nr:regulatory signaling modulator protein AmpE [Kangiellaceae bacterium]